MKGDKFCIFCTRWIGNYITGDTPDGPASYYSIIRRKYCNSCRPWKRAGDNAFNSSQYRQRKKALAEAKDQRLLELADEVRALRELVKEYRR